MNKGRIRRLALPLLLTVLALAPIATAGPDTPDDPYREFAGRRAALADHLDTGTFVLFGPADPGIRATFPEPNFRYLSGLTEPGSALVIMVRRPASTDRATRVLDLAREIETTSAALRALLRKSESPKLWTELSELLKAADRGVRQARAAVRGERGPGTVETRLYLRPRSKRREQWAGPTLFPGPEIDQVTGIESVRPIHRLVPDLLDLPEDSPLYLLDPGALAESALAELLAERPDLVRLPSRDVLARLRVIKSPTEISLIGRACDLTATGLLDCMRSCRPDMPEYELQAILEFACRRGGARRQAFDSIVASGPNGTILHYQRNSRRIRDGELVLMDVGAEVQGYAADITRTFPVSGTFTEEQARIYDVVLAAQKAAIAVVRPGVTLSEVNAAAQAVIIKAGLKRGWVHGVSHHVGLDVHDPGSSGPLRPGMVVTVEPGVYLPESGIGIRIEDTVVVTEDGCRVLSDKIVKERAEIEAIMSAGRVTGERGR